MKITSQSIFKMLFLFISLLSGCQLNNSVEEELFCCRHYTFTKMTNYKNESLASFKVDGEDYAPSKDKNLTFIEFHYDGSFIQKTTFESLHSENVIIYTTSGSYYQKEYRYY